MIRNTVPVTILILILITIISCSSVSDPDSAINMLESDSELTDEQVARIADTLALFPDNTQFSIAFVEDTSAWFYGTIRVSDSLKTISNHDAVFEIGSISKVFTSTLLAHAITAGLIDPDESVRPYLNFTLKDSIDFTFRQLSNHTSGLPRVPDGFLWNAIVNSDNPYKNFDREKLQAYLEDDVELESEPGTDQSYSNLGAGLLGYTLTLITGKTYEEQLKEYVFQPLQMERSTSVRSNVDSILVKGTSKRGRTASNWDLNVLEGAGGILSTVNDLSRFAIANFAPAEDHLELQQQITFRETDGMDAAMGWFVISRETGDKWYWHNGGTGGYRTSIVLDIENRKGVILLSNISAGHSHAGEIDRLSFDLLRFL